MGSRKKITENEHYNVWQCNNSGMFISTDYFTVGKDDWHDEMDFSSRKEMAIRICNELNEEIKSKVHCKCGHSFNQEQLEKLDGYDDAEPMCDNCYDDLKVPDTFTLPQVTKIPMVINARSFFQKFDELGRCEEVINGLQLYVIKGYATRRFLWSDIEPRLRDVEKERMTSMIVNYNEAKIEKYIDEEQDKTRANDSDRN